MLRRICTISLIWTIGWGLAFVVGCASDAQTGAVIGGLAGAGIGQLAGGHTESTLIGAAVGTGAGYMIGNESDKAKTQSHMYAMQGDINSQLVNVTNSNGSIVQVKLRRQGVGWVGPRGEYYPTLPNSEQLRPVYGF
ncbi:MAG: glycine zipper domain-containing protein [Planctomycetota bacterium]